MRALASATIIGLLFAAPAAADGVSPVSSWSNVEVTQAPLWHFQFTPYAWAPWVQGDATIRGRNFHVSQTPIQVLESLDFAFMGYMQARRGAITLFSDVIYADNSNTAGFSRSGNVSEHVGGTIGGVISANYRFWIAELGGMYETNRYRLAPGPGEADTLLELLGGIRYWHQDLSVSASLAGTANVDGLIVEGTEVIARSGSVDWVDPFIGARMTYEHSPTDTFSLRADIGGFGVGSQFSWHVLATYQGYLGSHSGIDFDGYLGYKALSVDYDQGNGINRYEFDVIQHGPVVGITGKF
jgi:hypothetical protein